MKYNRKEFLKIAGKFVLIGGFAKILKANKLFAAVAGKPVNKEYDIKSNLWGYGIDISKCIGCGRCVDACKKENNVPVITAQNAAKSILPKENAIIVNPPNIEANVPPAKPSKPSITPPDQQAIVTIINKGIYHNPMPTSPTKGM